MIQRPPQETGEIRAFIALDLPQEAKAALARLQDELKLSQVAPWVRWVGPNGIHLTLKFLGNVPAASVAQITVALEKASEGFSPLIARLSALGGFPTSQRPRVIWVGIAGDTEGISALQKRLEEALKPLGFPKEGREFSPHLTLGRVREGTPREIVAQLAGLIASTPASGGAKPADMRLETVSLIRSQLTPQGAIYSPLATITLRGP